MAHLTRLAIVLSGMPMLAGCRATLGAASSAMMAANVANAIPANCVVVALMDRGPDQPAVDLLRITVQRYKQVQAKDIVIVLKSDTGCPTGDDMTAKVVFELPQDPQKRWSAIDTQVTIPANSDPLLLDSIAFLAAYNQTSSAPLLRPGVYELRTRVSITTTSKASDGTVSHTTKATTRTIALEYAPAWIAELTVHASLLAGGQVIGPAARRHLTLTAIASPIGLHGRLLWFDNDDMYGSGLEILPFGAGGTLQTSSNVSNASIATGAFIYPVDILLPVLNLNLGIGGGILLFFNGGDPMWTIGISTLAPYLSTK